MAKKKASAKKPARGKKPSKKSRLDTAPLQEHIRKRIKELEGKATKARAGDDTLERLRNALETLEDICHPSMTVPI